jgi:hypothetical protein
VIFGVALPVIHVDLRQAGDQKLQFLFIEDCNELGRNDIVETYATLAIIFKC